MKWMTSVFVVVCMLCFQDIYEDIWNTLRQSISEGEEV